MFEGQHHRTPCGAHWSISPEVKGPRDPGDPLAGFHISGTLKILLFYFFLTLRKWYEMAAVTLVLLQPSPSCWSSALTPPRLPSRPGPEVSGMRAEEMPRRPQHPQPARALVVLAGAVTARGQTPAALTRRSCQPQTLSNRARERALQLQPPSDRHPGRHGPQGKYFLKVTLWFWRDYLP